ncbi:nucleotidyltransferase family protein [Natrinema soli]|uniref:NTP transferase domain-containing protein n=1 Tax=Natrinema soli TaxID=1930624 RepID=A0ABD5SJL0_9EURY|nr:nucleotidyltransferase family protein [Natrinema soli]
MIPDDFPCYGADAIADALERTDPLESTIVGVVLAGGTSSRFGSANKLLAELDGEPLIRHASRTLVDAALSEVIVILGYEAEAVRTALSGVNARTISNPSYEEGLSTSVEAAIRAVGTPETDAVVFLPGDMPTVDSSTVQLLVDAYRAELGTALAAAYDGHRGNPVLFDRSHFDALLDVTGDVGGLPVLAESDDSALIETGDPGVLVDIDTITDLRHQE